jgi:Fe-S-cluster-containing dehydrogenase component
MFEEVVKLRGPRNVVPYSGVNRQGMSALQRIVSHAQCMRCARGMCVVTCGRMGSPETNSEGVVASGVR